MKQYKPTYFLNQAVHSSEKFDIPSPSAKTPEANRGGLNKIQTELNNSERSYIQDQKDFVASLADPIYQCPPPVPTPQPTPTSPSYFNIQTLNIIP
jgi:hypothetical protein